MAVLGEEIEKGRADIVGRLGLVPDAAWAAAAIAALAPAAPFGFAVGVLAEVMVSFAETLLRGDRRSGRA